MLLKYYPSVGLGTRDNGVLGWLDQHGRCHPKCGGFDLGDDPGFTLHTEGNVPPPRERIQ